MASITSAAHAPSPPFSARPITTPVQPTASGAARRPGASASAAADCTVATAGGRSERIRRCNARSAGTWLSPRTATVESSFPKSEARRGSYERKAP